MKKNILFLLSTCMILSCNTLTESIESSAESSKTYDYISRTIEDVKNYSSDSNRMKEIEDILENGVVYNAYDKKYNYSKLFRAVINESTNWWTYFAYKTSYLSNATDQEIKSSATYLDPIKRINDTWRHHIDSKVFTYYTKGLNNNTLNRWNGEVFKNPEINKKYDMFWDKSCIFAFKKSQHKGPIMFTTSKSYTLPSLEFKNGCGFSILHEKKPPTIFDYQIKRIFHKKNSNEVYIELVEQNIPQGESRTVVENTIYMKTILTGSRTDIPQDIPEDVIIDVTNYKPASEILRQKKKYTTKRNVFKKTLRYIKK